MTAGHDEIVYVVVPVRIMAGSLRMFRDTVAQIRKAPEGLTGLSQVRPKRPVRVLTKAQYKDTHFSTVRP